MTADMASGGGSPGAEQGSVVGPKEAQGSPSLRGVDSSQMPTQLNDQPPSDDADSKQVCHCDLNNFILNVPFRLQLAHFQLVHDTIAMTQLQAYYLVRADVGDALSLTAPHLPDSVNKQNSILMKCVDNRTSHSFCAELMQSQLPATLAGHRSLSHRRMCKFLCQTDMPIWSSLRHMYCMHDRLATKRMCQSTMQHPTGVRVRARSMPTPPLVVRQSPVPSIMPL